MVGARQVERTVRVAGAGGVEVDAVTTETYDRQGRLYQLTEPSGPSGADVTTTYTYDVGNRLTSAVTTSGATTQTRSFDYDNRGFLESETLPEKGEYGNGTVSYLDYDAGGHAWRTDIAIFSRAVRDVSPASIHILRVPSHRSRHPVSLPSYCRKPFRVLEFSSAYRS